MTSENKITLLSITTIGSLIGLILVSYLHFSTPTVTAYTADAPADLDLSSIIELDTSTADISAEKLALTGRDILELFKFNNDLNLQNQVILDDMTKKLRHISPYAGEWISTPYARAKHKAFTKWNTAINLRKELSPRAFAFGIHKLDTLLEAIHAINAGELRIQPDSLKIQGVRFYLTFTKFENKKDRYIDLMGVPVLGNGTDYPSVSKDNVAPLNTEIIINTSSPCPKMCAQ